MGVVAVGADGGLAVVFFIVMTAWGWSPAASQLGVRVMLGALLTAILLPLLIPFTRPATGARRAVYGSLALATLAFLAAIWWESLG